MDAIYLQVAAVAVVVAGYAAAQAWTRHAKDEDERRAREVAQGEWAGVAVRKAVDAVNAGLVAAVVASSSVAASS